MPAAASLLSERADLGALKGALARLERLDPMISWGVIPFGDSRVDGRLPGGGLARGRLHDIAGDSAEQEAPAAAAGFAAHLLARCLRGGAIVWALQRDDLYAPGLAAFGAPPERVIYVRAENDAELLGVLEDALRARGVDAVLGEIAGLSLAAGKRLQLACEQGGATAFLLRRKLYGARGEEAASPASTRWRVAAAPSAPTHGDVGLGPPQWRAALTRCRGGRTGAWIMEAEDGVANPGAPGALRVVAELADHALAPNADDQAGPAGSGDRGERRQRAAAHRG